MFNLSRLTARVAAVASFVALGAAACNTDSTAPISPTSADRALTLAPFRAVSAASPLGLAGNFAALGGAGVTCTSPNPPLPAITIAGNVGSLLAAPSSVTGFPNFTPGANPCSLSGTVQLGATAALADLVTAYNNFANLPCPSDAPHNLSGNLGGLDLAPGIYCISGVGLLTGPLPLTLRGGANATWIFKAASSITPIGGSVVMAGGGNACNVYWQLGTAATFDNTDFVGNVLAGSKIAFTGIGSSLVGRALAKIESVTLTGASITGCVGGGKGGGGDDGDNDDGDDDHGDKGHHDKDKDKDHDKNHNDRDKDKNHGGDRDRDSRNERGDRNGRDN